MACFLFIVTATCYIEKVKGLDLDTLKSIIPFMLLRERKAGSQPKVSERGENNIIVRTGWCQIVLSL